jgi:predicted adenylyl cyclase CyaB
MAKNLELKIKMDSFEEIERILSTINAEFIKTLQQKDIYYKVKNGLLKLRIEEDKYQLIKYLRDESGKDRWSDYEIITTNGNNPEHFFDNIFQVETVVSKTRKLYIFRNTRIHLDTVRSLGIFLELETLLIDTLEEAKGRFNEISKLLCLDTDKQIKTSYRNLMLSK